MKRNVVRGSLVILAAVLALPFVPGMADAKPTPEALIIGPSSATVENGGTIVIRGAVIKGSAKDMIMSLHVKSSKLVRATVVETVHRGNVVTSDVIVKSAFKKGRTVTDDIQIVMVAADNKAGKKITATKTITVTVLAKT